MNTSFLRLLSILFVVIVAASLFASNQTLAQSDASQILINADQTELTENRYILEGNVQIVFQGQHLSADHATVDLENKIIEAEGNIILTDSKIHAEGTRLRLNYEDNTGTIFDGFVQSGQVLFEGSVINKIGPDEYVALDGEYTACTTCPPGWAFSGKEIEAELGGYAYIKYPILKVGGIPVFFLPRILVPLKSDRQSGLLVPSMDYSRSGGLALSQSYFWAIARNKDLTYTLKNYKERGWKNLFDYRFVMTPESRGRFQTAFIQDEAFKEKLASLDEAMYRWYGKYDHHFELPYDITHRADLNLVSDLRYPRDFPEEIEGHGDPALVNRISLTQNTAQRHLSLDTAYYVNLLQSDPLADNNAIHRFPEIRYSLVEQRLGNSGFLFQLDTNYVNFTRSGFNYDDITRDHTECQRPGRPRMEACVDPARDGAFDPQTDIIRTGQRFDLSPSLSLPFQVGDTLDFLPRLTYRETQYRFNLDESYANTNYGPTAARRYIQADLSAKTQFSRVFGDLKDPLASRWKHEIEPEVTLSTIPWIRRPDHGFFGAFESQPYTRTFEPISDEDFFGRNKVQFDYRDRVFDKKIVDLGVTNRIVRKHWVDGNPEYKILGTWRLSQSYDINEASDDTPHPWSAVNSILDVRLDHFETYTTLSYHPYAQVTNTSARVKFKDDRGDFIQLSYTNSYLLRSESEVDLDSKTVNWGLAVGLKSRYLDLTGQVNYSNITYKILSWQYLAEIKPPGECWGFRFGHRQVIGGDLQFTFNFAFNFGGGTEWVN